MAKAIIGGETLEVSLPNFKALKGAWKSIKAATESDDPMDSVDGILGVIAFGTSQTVEALEEKLLPLEIRGLRLFIADLMTEITPPPPAGEAEPEREEASPSTATSDASSTS